MTLAELRDFLFLALIFADIYFWRVKELSDILRKPCTNTHDQTKQITTKYSLQYFRHGFDVGAVQNVLEAKQLNIFYWGTISFRSLAF